MGYAIAMGYVIAMGFKKIKNPYLKKTLLMSVNIVINSLYITHDFLIYYLSNN